MATDSASTQVSPELIARAPVPSIYVEGVAQMVVGFPNSRIMLYSHTDKVIDDPQSKDTRYAACELVMPTAAVMETAKNLLKALAVNKENLMAGKTEWSKRLDVLFGELEGIPSVPATGS